jgi:hypothetical protein
MHVHSLKKVSYKICAGHSGRAVWGIDLDRFDAEIVGSNPAKGMDVCPRLSVFWCRVYVEAFAADWSLV